MIYRRFIAGLSLVSCVLIAPAYGQEGYKLPPQDMIDIVDAAPAPSVLLSPARDTLLLMHRQSLPSVAELARPMERLAGERLDLATNGPHGPHGVVGLSLMDLETRRERPVRLPEGGIDNLSWTSDGRYVAFTLTQDDMIGLWVLDVAQGRARAVVDEGINAVFDPYDWMADGETLLVKLVSDTRGPVPTRSLVPQGPAIQEAGGYEAPVRTYQDLLKDDQDAALFAWMASSQLATVKATGGRVRTLGEPGLYSSVDPAPGGEYILVTQLKEPFSYQVPWDDFANSVYVLNLRGERIAEIANHPIADYVPIGGVITGRRGIEWQDSHPAQLIWAEALDGGDPRVEAEQRDSVWSLEAPFTGNPVEVLKTNDRYYGTQFTSEGEIGFAVEYNRDTRVLHQWIVDFDQPGAEPRLLEERNVQDSYGDIGDPLTIRNAYGRNVAAIEDGALYFTGNGASPDGDRPFLNKVDFATLETQELWRNSGENYERVLGLTAPDASSFLTLWEDPITPTNVHWHQGDQVEVLTHFENPHPQLNEIKKELITYTREDGVPLSATLYLPADYQEGDKLPVLVWAYPLEYNNAATAGQVRGSQYRFTRVAGTSPRFMVTQGYALLEDATMPIVGDDPETVNDTFIHQLVLSAEAARDETVRRGFGDGERLAVAGHSYGAFMTAHLLAGSDIFRAGIARSGAYNRTLTPFGFQSERRTFWAAKEVYYELSPFMHADEINEPFLMIHGDMDNNSGTYPMQSERMFAAVKGNGGTARLVMLPYESHGYRGRENVLHVLAESLEWLDRWVKPLEDPMAEDAATSASGE